MLDVNKLPQLKSPSAQQPKKQSALDRINIVLMGKNGLMLIIGLVLTFYLIFCYTTEHQLKNQVNNFFKEIGSNGFGVSYSPKTAYFAFGSGIYLDDVIITAPSELGAWQLKTGRLTVSANPLSKAVKISFNGTHSLATKTIGETHLVVENGELSVKSDEKSGNEASFVLENMQAAAPRSMAGFSISDLKANLKKTDFSSYAFDLTMNGGRLPAYMTAHLTPEIEYIAVQGTINGFSQVRTKPVYIDWTDNSGVIELTQAEIIWKPFMAQASGTLGFDKSFKSSAALVTKVYGFFDLLDKLERAQYIRPSQVSLAKIVLGEKLKQNLGEAIPSLTMPFSVQDGKYYAGQVPLN